MAVYKVIQDVEADDKLLGPLSLKQFIFAGVGAACIYLTFYLVSRGFWPAIIIFLPIIFVSGLLAFPWGRDQPTEIWLAARIRFLLHPRRRIWNQSGIKELVTITVPKTLEKHLTKSFSGDEASSRLTALASVLDSRGWAIKNSAVNISAEPAYPPVDDSDDRLLDTATLPKEETRVEVTASDDIMDADNNAVAQNFDKMIQQSEREHRAGLQAKINASREQKHGTNTAEAADVWFEGEQKSKKPRRSSKTQEEPDTQPNLVMGGGGQTVAPVSSSLPIAQPLAAPVSSDASDDDKALIKRLEESRERAKQSGSFAHLKTIQPLGAKSSKSKAEKQAKTSGEKPSDTPVNPAIMQLAQDNDKNVATLAREAKRDNDQHDLENEVTVSLH